MSAERLKRCLEPGVSLLVGSVSAAGVPAVCRAVALTATDNLSTATTYLPLATSQDTIANVASTHWIAVAATNVVDHCSTQLKGIVTNVRLARDDESPLLRAQLDQFGDVVDALGLPKRIIRTVAVWPAFAVEFRVDEIYDQTPGPQAGAAL